MSASTTTGNSSPLALWTVIRRTPSLPSSTIGASVASPRSAASRSVSTNPRNDKPSLRSYWRASSATCSTLASTCSPLRRSAKPTCARVRSNKRITVSATGRRLRAVCSRASAVSVRPMGCRCAGRSGGTLNGCNARGYRCRYSSSSSSPIANSAPRSVANTDSSSSGHSIAASAARSVSISSRSWNARPPTSRCRTPRASSAFT